KPHFDSRCYFGDKIIGLPTAIGATIYFYNTALFDAKGIKYPEWGYTTDQFLADAVKLSDRSKKIFGATIQTRIWRAEMFAWGARRGDHYDRLGRPDRYPVGQQEQGRGLGVRQVVRGPRGPEIPAKPERRFHVGHPGAVEGPSGRGRQALAVLLRDPEDADALD